MKRCQCDRCLTVVPDEENSYTVDVLAPDSGTGSDAKFELDLCERCLTDLKQAIGRWMDAKLSKRSKGLDKPAKTS